jgi:hypothetical protein
MIELGKQEIRETLTLALLKFKFCVSAKSGSDPEIPQRPKFRISRILPFWDFFSRAAAWAATFS